jgi:hypothetical protein
MQQNRVIVLRCGESVGCDLLIAAVRRREDQSQSKCGVSPMVARQCSMKSSQQLNVRSSALTLLLSQ